MNTNTAIPTWFWVIGVLAFLWNLLGCVNFFSQITMTTQAMANLPEGYEKLYSETPVWVNIAFGTAVITGVIGSIGLLLRKGWAMPVFIVSLISVVVQQIYSYFLSDMLAVMGTSGIPIMGSVLVIAILLVFFSRKAKENGWLA